MQQTNYKHYLLAVLTIILVFNYVDRLALGVLLEDIKADLQLSDTQLGFLSGIAFALFYSVMGVPIARWADRGNRVTIISVTALLWSVAVAMCGLAASFVQLLLIRVGVAVGEAGCIPPAFSLIADYFNRAERPRATAVYGMGGGIAFAVGYFLAGWLNEFYGWRMTFVLLGAPGVLLGALAWFTLKEPRRQHTFGAMAIARSRGTAGSVPTLREVCTTLWGNRTFRHLLLCLSVFFFFTYGMLQWLPAFFIRSYGMSTGEVGTWLALIYGVSTIPGTYLGGELATRYAPHDESLQLRAMTFAIVSAGLFSACVYLAPNQYWAFAWLFLASVGQTVVNGPLFSTIQTLVPEHMRAVAFALVYLFANLVGMGFGPLAAGTLSDAFRPWSGEESLRYASMLLAPGYFWVAWHSWQASRTVSTDLAALQGHHRDGEREAAGAVASVVGAVAAMRTEKVSNASK